MPRPDPALLDPARYRFSCELAPRFGDLDPNRHLNNVAIAGMIEDARVRFHHALGLAVPKDDVPLVVASLATEFVAQAYYPDPLTVHVAPLALGRTSFTLAHLALQGGKPVVFAQAVMVHLKDGVPAPLDPAAAAAVQPWMLR